MKKKYDVIDPTVYFVPESEVSGGWRQRGKETIEVIRPLRKNKVLDIGSRNLFTKEIESVFNIKIDNTTGDLDYELVTMSWDGQSQKGYDLVICSHIIEHLMNPLLMVENIKKVMTDNGNLVIAYPVRWTKEWHRHFHEIPKRDMWNLIAKAKMKVVYWEEHNAHKNFPLYFGVRPYIRHWCDKNIIFIATKEGK